MLRNAYLSLLVASICALAVYANLGGSALVLKLAQVVFLMFLLVEMMILLAQDRFPSK